MTSNVVEPPDLEDNNTLAAARERKEDAETLPEAWPSPRDRVMAVEMEAMVRCNSEEEEEEEQEKGVVVGIVDFHHYMMVKMVVASAIVIRVVESSSSLVMMESIGHYSPDYHCSFAHDLENDASSSDDKTPATIHSTCPRRPARP